MCFGEVEAGLIDVDGDDAGGTSGFGDGTGKDADRTDTEDEDSLSGLKIGSSGRVEEHG